MNGWCLFLIAASFYCLFSPKNS